MARTEAAVLKLAPNKAFLWAYQRNWSNVGYQNTWNGFANNILTPKLSQIEASDNSPVVASDGSPVTSR